MSKVSLLSPESCFCSSALEMPQGQNPLWLSVSVRNGNHPTKVLERVVLKNEDWRSMSVLLTTKTSARSVRLVMDLAL